VNDDFDLDARLRAGARAFPPAPAPDSAQLRDVLTASRRRSRRTQGSVLACATAAVTGGAALALRDPQAGESVEVAGPATTSPDLTSALPPSTAEWDGRVRELLCTPDGLVRGEVPPDAQVLTISSGPDWALPEPVVVTVEGETVTSSDPAVDPTSALADDPVWTLMLGPDDDTPGFGHLVMVMAPFQTLGPHEITMTAGGRTGTLHLSSDEQDAWMAHLPATDPATDLFATVDEHLDIGWSRVEAICAAVPRADDVEPDTTTSVPAAPPTTEVPADDPSSTTTSTVPADHADPVAPATTVPPTLSDDAPTTAIITPSTTIP
jgi:hypothetical protein